MGTLTLRTQVLNSRRPRVKWKPGVTRKSPKIKQSKETKRISRKFTINSFCHRHLPASHNSYDNLLRNQPFVGVHVLNCQLIYKIIRAVLKRHINVSTGCMIWVLRRPGRQLKRPSTSTSYTYHDGVSTNVLYSKFNTNFAVRSPTNGAKN